MSVCAESVVRVFLVGGGQPRPDLALIFLYYIASHTTDDSTSARRPNNQKSQIRINKTGDQC
jgi:hypothetical protein